MSNNFRKIILFILIIACFSCSNRNDSKIPEFGRINSTEFEGNESFFRKSDKLPIKISATKFEDPLILKLSSFVDSIWYIKLSNEEDAIIGAINKVKISDNCIYILDRYKTKSLKKFAADGSYVSTIGKQGEGPGEYFEPTDFIITDNEIIVYDQFNIRLNFYNKNGEFRRSKKLPFLFFQFHQFSPNQYLFSSLDNDNDHLKSIVNYSIFETDSNFVIKNKGFFREKNLYSTVFIDGNFSFHNNLVFYHPPFNDTIFSISLNSEITPDYYIDFGEKKLPTDYLLAKNWEEFKKLSEKDRYVEFGGPSISSNDFLYFEFALKRLTYKCIYSKKTNTLITGNTLINNINYIFSFNNVLTFLEENILVGYNQPYDMIETRQKYSREESNKLIGEEYTNIVYNIKIDDNPILVFFKLKNL